MKRLRPDTFVLTLPDGKKVRCWRRDAEQIRMDVMLTGNVYLKQNKETGIYERVSPQSVEGAEMSRSARRVG